MATTKSLLPNDLPAGFLYQDEFLTRPEESVLLEAMAHIELSEFEMRGVVARRRVAFFGETYGRAAAGPIPEYLWPLRARIADWIGIDSAAFVMALVNEYRPGAPVGWHRDAPRYEIVAGVSLLSACRMKFRHYRRAEPGSTAPARRATTHELELTPRSAYLMTQESRHEYEHHIPAVRDLRYSITFRTLRRRRLGLPPNVCAERWRDADVCQTPA